MPQDAQVVRRAASYCDLGSDGSVDVQTPYTLAASGFHLSLPRLWRVPKFVIDFATPEARHPSLAVGHVEHYGGASTPVRSRGHRMNLARVILLL
ncbi:hypothetical protein POX_b03256 [Penicillium oxalicum]|uniref:Uncharacterized protein n=1 Tax=Penicillium oxalicum (strain 114-2 / CGMCC 5302) TaxID=933388 RepID=S8AUA7_PENO1|nr:hypothetical protein POX_b03256 [Penicillium oxalicum]EPS29723.1 hypothetical protein PDE_04673 [Penicillium oxalicum 114-2]KAI2793205.1 hypothetical protein POX_b03256 [Penicillium oxalicum]